MEYIIIDLEFNQPFNFSPKFKTVLNPGCPSEIIQIGAVKVSENMEVLDEACYWIRPRIYKKLHPYIGRITGLTDKDLSHMPSFQDVYDEFLTFTKGRGNVLAFWGGNDIKELCRNIKHYNLRDAGLPKRYLDVQLMAAKFLGRPAGFSVGLKAAASELGLTTTMPFHDALYDARYTAMVFSAIDRENMNVVKYTVPNLSKLKKKVKPRPPRKAEITEEAGPIVQL